MGGLKYTKNVEILRRRYQFEEGFRKKKNFSSISKTNLFSKPISLTKSEEKTPPPGC
jgi:hypothetical protein